MILKRIKIYHFKSIYEPLELNFDELKGFWKIEGPVGSGKTSIGEAIIYGLFGDVKGKNIPDLISWGERKGTVEIDCESRGHQLHIERVIKGDLTVLVDGEPMVFTNKRDAQSQLEEEYYDVSKMTLELLCIISFNNFKSLSNMNPADSRAFLDQVFGFSLLSQYSDACKEQLKTVQDESTHVQNEIRSLSAQIQKIKDLSNYQKIEGDIEEVRTQIAENKKDTDNFTKRYNDFSQEKRTALREKTDELARLKALGTNKAKEIKFIEQGTCPTCGAPIDQSQLMIKKEERDVLLKSYQSLSAEIGVLQDDITKYSDKYMQKLGEMNAKTTELTSLRTKLEEQQKRLSINTAEIKQLNENKQIKEDEYKSLQMDAEEWNQLFDILSVSMRQQILSSFIPLLNSSIQEYTRQLQLPYIIEFDNQFKCTIKIFGLDKQINISSLSTGQLKTIDMCVILGVLKVIFCGVHFNVMFLDELFSNMDSELRSMVCRVLKNELKQNQTIFIISHQEVSDATFDGTITASLSFKNNTEYSSYEIKPMNS